MVIIPIRSYEKGYSMNKTVKKLALILCVATFGGGHISFGAAPKAQSAHPFRDLIAAIKSKKLATVKAIVPSQIKASTMLKPQTPHDKPQSLPALARKHGAETIALYFEAEIRKEQKTAGAAKLAAHRAATTHKAKTVATTAACKPAATHKQKPFGELIQAIKGDNVGTFKNIVPSQISLNDIIRAKPGSGYQDQTVQQYINRIRPAKILQHLNPSAAYSASQNKSSKENAESAGNEMYPLYVEGDDAWALNTNTDYPFTIDGKKWPSVTHYRLAHSLNNATAHEAIRTAQTAAAANEIFLANRKYANHSIQAEPLIKKAVYAKITQHATLKAKLLDSQKKKLYFKKEAGISTGLETSYLQEVRDSLRAQSATAASE